MRDLTALGLGLFLALMIGGCASEQSVSVSEIQRPVLGSGTLRSETRSVAGFSQIALSGSGKLIIRQTDTDSLEIEAEDNILPLLTSSVSHGTLWLGIRNNSLNPARPITYRITLKKLDGLKISGSGDAEITGVNTDYLSTDISGSGSITVSGRATQQSIQISGHGDYQAKDLDSDRADFQISGSGNAVLKVKDRLEAEISGNGAVEYIGNPSTSLEIHGSGTVKQQSM